MQFRAGKRVSEANAVAGVPAGGLTGPDDFHDVAAFQAVVSGDRVGELDAGQLCLLQATAQRNEHMHNPRSNEGHALFLQQSLLLIGGEHLVSWDERMVCDIHKEVCLGELLQSVSLRHGDDDLYWSVSPQRVQCEIWQTFLAEGVMIPGKMMMPRSIFFSSKMPMSLRAFRKRVRMGERSGRNGSHLRMVLIPTLFSSEKKMKIWSVALFRELV
jgi:hypothetical protein